MKLDNAKNLVINYYVDIETRTPGKPIVLIKNSRMWTEFLIKFGLHIQTQTKQFADEAAETTFQKMLEKMKSIFNPTVEGCMPFNQ